MRGWAELGWVDLGWYMLGMPSCVMDGVGLVLGWEGVFQLSFAMELKCCISKN